MINLIYKILYKISKSNGESSIFFKYIRRVSKLILNTIYPMYYKLFKRDESGVDPHSSNNVIISLTSFPARINHVWLCIETLLRQTTKPNKIILWLASSQFDGLDSLPTRLVKLQERGLTIRFCEDLRPHKKYYYTMLENPDSNVIIVDDDMFYPSNLVSTLLEKSKEYPGVIICNRGHYMRMDGNEIASYKRWTQTLVRVDEPSFELCPTGCGGVLYPPKVLHKEVFNKNKIYELCLNADDLWLKIMSLKNGVKAIKTDPYMISFIDIMETQAVKLTSSNVGNNLNDVQLKKIITNYNFDLSKYIRLKI